MTALVRYEAARAALSAAASVDEVKDVLDIGVAMQIYARQAKDCDLIDKATEIRLRAERRLGSMIVAQKETVGLAKGAAGIGKPASAVPEEYRTQPPTLASVGIDKKLSARAQKIAAIPESKFETHLAAAKKQAVDALRMTTAEKQQRRAERESELAAKQLALPATRYGVISADPPWRFEVYSEDTGQGRAAEAHYPTMGAESITALDVPSIAADDCVLFLWSTAPTMPEAFDLLKAWGFVYKSQCIWAKDKIGLGFWFRNQHEILIVAVKGNIPAPAHGTQWPSLIQASRGKHSEKPAVFYELIEAYFPTLPKIELFARGEARPGWNTWGLEAARPSQ